MESCDFVDSIKAEKANALARYRTFKNITKLFQLIEVFVAVAVISWSSSRLPLVVKFSGEYVSAFTSCFMNQHVVFLVGNLIVVACYVLSRYSDSGNESGDSGFHSDRFTHRKTTSDAPNAIPIRSSEPVQIQNLTNRNENSVIKTVKASSEITGESEITPERKQIERFQRTRSEKVKSESPVRSSRELRRSVTEMRRGVVVTSAGKESPVKSFQAVEKLSNEEFRIRVETFIMKQQRFLKQQSMVEVEDGS